MKKTLIILAFIIAASSFTALASAQSTSVAGVSPPQTAAGSSQTKHRMTVSDVLDKLDLTADQKERVKVLLDKNKEAVKELRQQVMGGKVTNQDAKKKLLEMRKANQATLKTILTTAQSAQYASLMKEARAKNKPDAKGDTKKSGVGN